MNKKLIFNTLGHQLIWWSSVLGAIFGMPYLGAIVMVPVLTFHLLYTSEMKNEFILILLVAILGTIMDTFYNVFGIVSYTGTYSFASWLAPIWITTMWVGFSTTINYSLKKLNKKKYIGFILGAVFGPIAYLAGERYGAISLMQPKFYALIILSLSWGGIIPLLFKISEQIKKESKNETKAFILPVFRKFHLYKQSK
jgi:hypothetical protein